MSNFKTAESVSPKHPDKICDQISDAILDAYLTNDPLSRTAIEVVGGHGKVYITGEVNTKSSKINLRPIVKRLAGNVEIIENISIQSPNISSGVDNGGAGDQGIMIGYATNETPELLPLEYVLANKLNKAIFEKYPYDGKTQITIKDKKIISIVASFQNVSQDTLKQQVIGWLHNEPLAKFDDKNINLFINPAGDWKIGGFDADSGLTGRKLVIDNYGPQIPIGGGAFSGKDATKVDRSAAYMARKIAVDYLKKYNAKEVFVRLAYAIGYDQPLEATATVDGKRMVISGYDLSPNGIINFLDLRRPIFEATARYGHFNSQDFIWNK
jgi:S-adenosylmethionine synthetase